MPIRNVNNQKFSDVFIEYKKRSVVCNGSSPVIFIAASPLQLFLSMLMFCSNEKDKGLLQKLIRFSLRQSFSVAFSGINIISYMIIHNIVFIIILHFYIKSKQKADPSYRVLTERKTPRIQGWLLQLFYKKEKFSVSV